MIYLFPVLICNFVFQCFIEMTTFIPVVIAAVIGAGQVAISYLSLRYWVTLYFGVLLWWQYLLPPIFGPSLCLQSNPIFRLVADNNDSQFAAIIFNTSLYLQMFHLWWQYLLPPIFGPKLCLQRYPIFRLVSDNINNDSQFAAIIFTLRYICKCFTCVNIAFHSSQ